MVTSCSMPNRNVFTEVVANDLCVGCGVCAAMCPTGHIAIEAGPQGHFRAVEATGRCANRCGVCLRVCPFSDQEEDEDWLGRKHFAHVQGMQHRPETGYYLEALVGYSCANAHRQEGASGGLATWALESLLADGRVQAALCVLPTGHPGSLFEYRVCAKTEEVRAASRSCYYPVELSAVIRHVLSHEGRYAVTALPCYAKALRRAMEVSPRLNERITCILGLVCGQSKTRFLSEYLCALAGGDPQRMREVTFRLKTPGRSASDACTRFVQDEDDGGSRELLIHNSQWAPNSLWTDGYFTPNPCFFCDDVFAECAGAAFMDAWLPAYEADWRGHSIGLIRDPGLAGLFRNGRERGGLVVELLDIGRVIESQRPAIVLKRGGIAERVRFAQAQGLRVPTKRKTLYGKYMLGRLDGALVRCQWLLSRQSGQQWPMSEGSVAQFRRRMRPIEAKARLLRRLLVALQAPADVPALVVAWLRGWIAAQTGRGGSAS